MAPARFGFLHRRGGRSGSGGLMPAERTRRGLVTLAAALLVLGGIVNAAPALAENAALYEQDGKEPHGKRYAGTVTWRLDKEPAGAGHGPGVVLRADITIPERRMTASWVLRRNTDKALPATHTLEVMFKLPADYPNGGIANVPAVTLKPTEDGRGTPLAGLIVKVTDGFYLIGLSAIEGDAKLNADILRDGKWLDILIVYGSGMRAVLTLEKGPSGATAFTDALAAWGK
jgi:hypothetical protein